MEKRLELFRLESIEHSSYFLSKILGTIILFAILLLFFISFSLFLGFFLGDLLDSTWAGFGIIGGFYLVVFLILNYRFKSTIQLPLQNKLIKELDDYGKEEV